MREAKEGLGVAELRFQSIKLQLKEEETQRFLYSADNPEKSYVKLLGFVLNSKLKREPHLAEVCKRIARELYLLRKLHKLVTQPYLLTA